MIWPLRPQGQGLGAVWPPKRVRSGGLFLLTSFIFCYFLLLFFTAERGKVCYFLFFFTARNFCKLFFYCSRFIVCYFLLLCLLLVSFINYFLLLRRARGIVLLYLFIVQGEGVCLDFFFFKCFYCWGGGGVEVYVFFFSFIWHVEGGGEVG